MQISLPNFAFLPLNHLGLLKDRILKKMLSRAKTHLLFFFFFFFFFLQNYRLRL